MTRDNEDSLLRSVALQNAESVRAVRLRAEQQAEAAVREQANLLNLTHDAIFVRDMNGTVKYWNRGAEDLYGWPAEQAVGRVILELLKTIFQVPLEQIEEEVIGAGRWEGELVQTKKDGSQVVVASRWSLQRDENSAPVAILVINNDITKRKRAEEVARRSEKELREVVNAVPAFVWSTLPTAPSISSMTVGSSSRVWRRRMHWVGTGKPQFIPVTGRGPSPSGAQH